MVKNFTGKELQEFKDNFKILSYCAPTTFKSTICNCNRMTMDSNS